MGQGLMDYGVGQEISQLTDYGSLGDLLVAVILLAIASMALVQVGKALPLVGQKAFQERFLDKWFREHAAAAESEFQGRENDLKALGLWDKTGSFGIDADPARIDLENLALPGARAELYKLQSENLNGQLNAALQVILDEPRTYFELLCIFAHSAGASTILSIFGRKFKEEYHPWPTLEADSEMRNERSDALNLVGAQVQRSLDAIQITMGQRRQLQLKVAAVIAATAVSVAMGLSNYPWGTGGGPLTLWDGLFWVGLGVVGGAIAPVVRDFAVMLRSFRTRTQ